MVRHAILLNKLPQGSDTPPAGAKVAPRGTKIKRRERVERGSKSGRDAIILPSPGSRVRSSIAQPAAA